jgi:FO synthase
MNESISRAAGTEHGQEFPPEAMEELIRSLGRMPEQRTTLYGPVPTERRTASLNAAALAPAILILARSMISRGCDRLNRG